MLWNACDLLEERARLVGECVVLPEADTRGVHREPAGDVGVLRSEDHLPVPVLGRGDIVQEELDLGGATLVVPGATVLAEDLEDEAVGVPGRDVVDSFAARSERTTWT